MVSFLFYVCQLMQGDLISIVIPAFNEEENLPLLIRRLLDLMMPYPHFEILVIDDGSTDQTLHVLQQLSRMYSQVRYLSFSRNFGHQTALRAGYENARGACVISMDADLQHPPELIPKLIQKWQEGFEVVYTVRQADDTLPVFKRKTSRWFYKVIQSISDLKLEEGAADFRLLDRKVVDALAQFKESDLFLRGTISWIGFRQCRLVYQPGQRFAGASKYSLSKMLKLALMGITSFSTKPLYLSVFLGFLMSGFACLFGLEVLYEKYFTHTTVSGWTSIVLLVVLIGGFQFIMMGIIGIYLGKTFQEVKQRPPYLIKESNGMEEKIIHEW